jgi:hypothetical protein
MIDLHGTKNGGISIEKIEQPYGPKSDPVVSIGIYLDKGNEKPDYKSHIPLANIPAIIAELQKHV